MDQEHLLTLAQSKLEEHKITIELDAFDAKLLEKCQASVFVCNQLIPGLDEWILVSILHAHFNSMKLINPYMKANPAELRPITIRTGFTPSDAGLFTSKLASVIEEEIQQDTACGLVLDFSENPIGYLGKNLLRTQILNQLRAAGQTVVPIHLVPERNIGGIWRKALTGLVAPTPNEPLRIQVRVGLPIKPDAVKLFESNRQWNQFIQAKIFSLGSAYDPKPEDFTEHIPSNEEPIAEPIDPALIQAEIEALKPETKMCSRGNFDVYIAPFMDLPNTMLEIGRLREITFRSVGEGSGKSRDTDEYDIYYLQLIIWDRDEKQIAGGYRIGQSDVIFKRFGAEGLYVDSLFKLKPGFYPILQQAVELGRSYVVPEYQKHRLPLFLLWKGILHFLLANPNYRYLYGPVSISKYYSEVSKSVIIEFVKQYFFDEDMAQLVKARKPFKWKSRSVNTRLIATNLKGEFEALEHFVEDIEPDHFKVPVLFRQYLKQSAKFIAFNVDPNFSDCLDGLMVLDISQLPASTIETLQQEK
jgi:putative hemolysin